MRIDVLTIQLGRQADVTIVVDDDVETLRDQCIEQRLLPHDHLTGVPVDQEQRGVVGVAERGVFEFDSGVECGARHVSKCCRRVPARSQRSQPSAACRRTTAPGVRLPHQNKS